MAFWGIEVKPGKPYVHRYDDEKGRLRVSQATLGRGSSTEKSIVQCKVGDKKPIYLCSLLPEKLETCALNLEFEEDDEVTFTVLGPHSVHLSGFFYGNDNDQDNTGDDYGDDLYEEDVMVTDSEDGDGSVEFDSEDEDEDYIDDDFGLYPSSPVPNSGVKIEEIEDDHKPKEENGTVKHTKRKEIKLTMSDDSEDNDRALNLGIEDEDGFPKSSLEKKSGTEGGLKSGDSSPRILGIEDEDGFPKSSLEKKSGTEVGLTSGDISARILGIEDEDGFPKSSLEKKSGTVVGLKREKGSEKRQKKNEKGDVSQGKGSKRKKESMDQDDNPASGSVNPNDSVVQISVDFTENEATQKDKKRKRNKQRTEKVENARATETLKSNGDKDSAIAENGNNMKPFEKNNEKRKKKKNKQQGSEVTANAKDKKPDGKSVTEKEYEIKDNKSSHVRSFPNGLTIEELSMGKPDGKRASPGKKVSVHYIGKLKKNGKIFDSNIGKAPFKFRLGIGQVIKGWDVGVNGMRIGDKRRLTIPPAMGYGSTNSGPIPPNSWLVFDVELVDVN